MPTETQPQVLLIGESFSPWTKKARWALEHCEISFSYKEYTPTLSEPGLRMRLRRWSDTVSVPVLFVGRQVFHGSWEIAQYANEKVDDERLGNLHAIVPWNELSEAALAEGRTRVLRCMLGNNKALEDALPVFVPNLLRPWMRFVARDAVRRLDRKYCHLAKPGAIRQALVHTRESLAQVDGDFLMGRFSYADIAMAVVIEIIAPIARTQPPLGSETKQCWIDQDLADEFMDLLAWRDRLASSANTSYTQFNA